MEDLLGGIIIQFSGLMPLIWGAVEFLAPKGKPWRRVCLVLYSWVFSFAAWMMGIVKLPEMIPRFSESLTAEIFVVLILGLGTAAITHQSHETAKKTFAPK